ncbi:folate-binding protein [Pseudonocardia sp. TMWB2A]|uniref:CAF17-like 4Fe-4S cluster assembly/insertion protein YgfZ n=1 Tax=Pseudonocardia sp. TMWB2A TaxID=687430 RepID=UPI00307F5F40
MTKMLHNRAILRLSATEAGEDVRAFLQGLVTQDMGQVRPGAPAWAALLTPQGKLLFDFILWADGDDILVDCEDAQADALAKRLSIYRLRRKIAIARDDSLCVGWSAAPDDAPAEALQSAPDPRLAALGTRYLVRAADIARARGASGDDAWRAHRLALGVTEGADELGQDKILWLECNAAELNGVSFTKGCYVGQENTARMNWRQKVNRRLVVVPLAQADEKRQMVAYPDLGLSVEHRRVEAIDRATLPDWLADALADAP